MIHTCRIYCVSLISNIAASCISNHNTVRDSCIEVTILFGVGVKLFQANQNIKYECFHSFSQIFHIFCRYCILHHHPQRHCFYAFHKWNIPVYHADHSYHLVRKFWSKPSLVARPWPVLSLLLIRCIWLVSMSFRHKCYLYNCKVCIKYGAKIHLKYMTQLLWN